MEREPLAFIGGAVFLVIIMAWRGWRLGIVRQVLSIVAAVIAIAGAVLLGEFIVPVLRSLGCPEHALVFIGPVVVGVLIYAAAMFVVAITFKRTAQQSVGVVKLGFGALGALLGAGFGLLLALALGVFLQQPLVLDLLKPLGIEKALAPKQQPPHKRAAR